MTKMDMFNTNHAMILKIISPDLCISIWNKIIYSMHFCFAMLNRECTSTNRQTYLVDYLLLMLGTLFWTFEGRKR